MSSLGKLPEKIQQIIVKLSQQVVLTEAHQMQALNELYVGVGEIGQWAESEGHAALHAALTATAGLLEKIMLRDVEDAEKSLTTVGLAVGSFQAVLCDGRCLEEVDFPPELGLNESETKASEFSKKGHFIELPSNVDPDILAEFLSRQTGVLEEMEPLILALERGDEEAFAALKRLIHTLKGESAMLGLVPVEKLCHRVEDFMQQSPDAKLTDALLAVEDWLRQYFNLVQGKTIDQPEPIEAILRKFAEAAAPEAESEAPAAMRSDVAPTSPASIRQLEGDLALTGDFVSEAHEHLESADVHLLTLETDPTQEEAVNAVFRAFHTLKGVAGFLGLDEIRELAHEAENLLDKARKKELILQGEAVDVSFDAVDMLKRLVEGVAEALTNGGEWRIEPGLNQLTERIKAAAEGRAAPPTEAGDEPRPESKGGAKHPKLGEILINSGRITEEVLENALINQVSGAQPRKLGEVLIHDAKVPAKDVAQALRSQKQGTAVQVKETVKVDADRLDSLVEMIGELVIASSMVSQSKEIRELNSASIARQMAQLDKITRELQEMGTSLRMVPIRPTFQKMARLVRDLSKKFDKPVDFKTAGEDTELDKTVVDRIGDPLVHMVRNSVDHGLETPEERRKAGKPEVGTVELRAFHKGGNIYIEIEDDGKGLDRDAILAKATERGLVRDGDTLSDREVFNLIFQPGFSTAKQVTDVSGRGVGMDVVRRNIEALRGRVDIASTPGKGTVFTIRLPLTLAIIDGMVVRVGEERFIIPTLTIVMSTRPTEDDLSTVFERGEMLKHHDRLIPLFYVNKLFTIPSGADEATQGLVVVIEENGAQVGLVVDELLGQQQIVIKNLGEALRGTPGLAGGAIMPDGRVGLILDVSGLVKLAHEHGVEQPELQKV